MRATGGAARDARRRVYAVCHEAGAGEVCDDAQLVVSELVANVVKHGDGVIDVRVVMDGPGRRLRIEVGDPAPGVPRVGTPGPESEGGRGLVMVQRLATAWGVQRREVGKVVWCELDWR